MKTIAIVGGSLAGIRAAETLRRDGFRGSVKIITEEPPCDRPPLSKEILVGEMVPDDVELRLADGIEVEWVGGRRATGLHLASRCVELDGGDTVPYEGLVIATGSAPRKLRGLEPDGHRVLDLRTLEDAIRLRDTLVKASRLVVVGCGFIGVEVASAARALDVEVTIVSLDPPLSQAGALVGAVAEELLREQGVELLLGRTVSRIARDDELCRIRIDDGQELRADAIVVAAGAAPNTDWLDGCGLDLDDGIRCDAALRAVGADNVVAAGDVARWPNPLFDDELIRIEHWNNAIDQGSAAARSLLAGNEATPFASVPSFWSDHFGCRLRSVGLPGVADHFEVIAGEVESRRFAAAAYRRGRLVGGVTYGIPKALARIRSQLSTHATVTTEA